MRIISGKFRGRRLLSVPGLRTRPTSDRVRENLFNILARHPVEANVLDLFAGTGALGIEALSRGARSAVFVENVPAALKILHANVEALSLGGQTKILSWDIGRNLDCLLAFPRTFDLVFMDPPYRKEWIVPTLQALLQSGSLTEEALVVVEHAAAEPMPASIAGLRRIDERRYGATRLTFLSPSDPTTSAGS